MRKHLVYLVAIFLLLFSNNVNAQIDLSQITLSASDSTMFILSNGRALLLHNIQQGEGDKNIEVMDNLGALINQNEYIPLFIDEEQLVSFLTGDKEFFLNSLKEKDWILEREFPLSDNLYDNCYKVLADSISYWETWIDKQELTEEEQMLYQLYLSQLGFGNSKSDAQRLSKKYIKTYTDSEFIPFAKSLKTDFNTGSMGYALGAGNIFLSESVTSIVDVSGLLSFEMDYFFNKLYCSFYIQGSLEGASLKGMEGIDKNGDNHYYDQGNSANHFSIGTKWGISLYKNKWLTVYPYGILSIANLSVSHTNSEIENFTLSMGLDMGAGVGTDIILFSWIASSIDSDVIVQHHLGLRFNAGFETVLAGKDFIDYSDRFFHAGIVWWMGD